MDSRPAAASHAQRPGHDGPSGSSITMHRSHARCRYSAWASFYLEVNRMGPRGRLA